MSRWRRIALGQAVLIGVAAGLLSGGSPAVRAGVAVGWMLVAVLGVVSIHIGRRAVAHVRTKFLNVAAGEDRGLASAFIGFFLIIIVAALMYTLLDPAMAEIVSLSLGQAPSQQATDAINRREAIWSNMLYFMLFLAAIFIIGNAVFESRRPG
jgi:hypothetical protein